MNEIITFVLYFLFFAGIHSILATDYIKKRAERLLGDNFRFYRLLYTILSFFTIVPAFLTWMTYSNVTQLVYSLPHWLLPFVLLVRLLATGLLLYAILQTDVLDFTGIRQLQGRNKSELITQGAYGVVRHPLYSGSIILLFTKMKMTQLDLTAIILISIYLIIGAFIEERRLLVVFGEEYRNYQKQVSMFIPVKWARKLISQI
ncbi:MAG: isoprenylcysteine carboxylmethyltransferase family protein [Candidatus Methanoperedens sp.]|nr:isoprenylcysteine carboxylmethyltransferase family protein [Candidatus Methanoperedens sp.]